VKLHPTARRGTRIKNTYLIPESVVQRVYNKGMNN
jgi:hypothetical protein